MSNRAGGAHSEMALGQGIIEVQRVRVELLTQIQEIQSVQETQLKELDARFSELQRDLKPKLQELETRNSSSQSQLEEARKKVQSLSSNDVSFLRRQYDELLMKFERFATVDVQSQLKPVQDDFRLSKAKLDELSASTSSSIKRLNEQVKALNESLAATMSKSQSENTKCATELDEMEPKLNALEQQIGQLRELLADAPAAAGAESLAKEIERIEKTIARIENDVLPEEVAKIQAPVNDGLAQLQQYSENEIQQLQQQLSELSKSHAAIDQRRKTADESLAANQNKSQEVSQKFIELKDNIRARLKSLEQKVHSKIATLKHEIEDFASSGALAASQFDNTVADDVGSLQKQILDSVRALRDQIREKTEANRRAHEDSLKRIAALQDQLEGRGNAVGRVKKLEDDVRELVNGLHDWEEKRASAGRIGATPGNIVARLARIEERITAAETRPQTIDGKQGIKPAAYSKPLRRSPMYRTRHELPKRFYICTFVLRSSLRYVTRQRHR
jgi:chromosome segregation ATPase